MCVHFQKSKANRQNEAAVTKKIGPLTELAALTPDEASALNALVLKSTTGWLPPAGEAVVARAGASVFRKLSAQTTALLEIQKQYPGYPEVPLPDGVVA